MGIRYFQGGGRDSKSRGLEIYCSFPNFWNTTQQWLSQNSFRGMYLIDDVSYIQVFVETLDHCFENVCELDLIFHVDKVHNILQETCMGGMVLETNMSEILTHIEAQNKLEKSEASPTSTIKVRKRILCCSKNYTSSLAWD